MKMINKAIDEYLQALAALHGRDYSEKTKIRPTGGTDVAIVYPDGGHNIVTVGMLHLMTEHLRNQAGLKQAA